MNISSAFVALYLLAQIPATPSFEAATVKPNKSLDAGSARSNLSQRGSHVGIIRFSLRMLIGHAYNLPTLSDGFNRILGLPKWADSEYFDIEAATGGETAPPQKRLMLQSLLAERFRLALHHEIRQRPVYAMVLIKTGNLGRQIHPHTDDSACQSSSSNVTEPQPARTPEAAAVAELQKFPCGRVVGGMLPGDSNLAWSGGRKVTMEMISASLGGDEPFDRPIIDRTGINGTFDFTIVWHTLLQTLSISPAADAMDATGTTLAQALREQLGLKLATQTGPVDVLVIDHADRPSISLPGQKRRL